MYFYIFCHDVKKADEPVFPGPNRLTSVHNSTTTEVQHTEVRKYRLKYDDWVN